MRTTRGDFHIRPWKFTLLIAMPIGLAVALALYCLVLGPLVNFCHVGNLLSVAFQDAISGWCNVFLFVLMFAGFTMLTLLIGEHVITKKYLAHKNA